MIKNRMYMDNNDKFQWKRVGMLFSLYFPMIKWQVVGYVILSVAVAGLMALGQRIGHVMFPVTVSSFILGIAYYLAPISFTRRDYRQISDILPVTASEKMVFLLLYFGIGTYLMLNGPFYLLHFLFPDYVPSYISAVNLNLGCDFVLISYISGFVSAFGMVSVSLWALAISKTSRAATIFGAVVAAMVASSFIGGIVGFTYAMTHLSEFENSVEDPAMVMNVSGLVKVVFIMGLVVSGSLMATFLTLLYRKLKRCGF